MSIEWYVYVGLTIIVAAAVLLAPAILFARDGRRLRGQVRPSSRRR